MKEGDLEHSAIFRARDHPTSELSSISGPESEGADGGGDAAGYLQSLEECTSAMIIATIHEDQSEGGVMEYKGGRKERPGSRSQPEHVCNRLSQPLAAMLGSFRFGGIWVLASGIWTQAKWSNGESSGSVHYDSAQWIAEWERRRVIGLVHPLSLRSLLFCAFVNRQADKLYLCPIIVLSSSHPPPNQDASLSNQDVSLSNQADRSPPEGM